MWKPSLWERIWHKLKLKMQPYGAKRRRKRLNNTDFTIISNNCWGGIVYEWFGLKKLSPTVGTFFFAEDYIKFVKNLREYLEAPLSFIAFEDSDYYESLKKMNCRRCPVGKIKDIEIFFLHYPDEDIARDKWERRVKRVNYENLIVKFSYMNNCTQEHLKEFDATELDAKKVMFVNKPDLGYKCGRYYRGFENEAQIWNDTFYFNKYIDIIDFINSNKEKH